MESLDTGACLMDDLLDFSIGEEDDDEQHNKPRKALPFHNPNGFDPATFNVVVPDDPSSALPDCAEEELEWLSNKDAFPKLETCFGILSEQQPGTLPKHHSPVSVLEDSTTSSTSNSGSTTNSSIITSYCGGLRVPVKARSKRHHRRRCYLQNQLCSWWSRESFKNIKPVTRTVLKLGRKCQHCGSEKTPQWRAGPLGPKTLCNACGVRFKSGRLVPEYRPANSPTFSSELHSNSHRKVMEMRKQKQMMGSLVVKPMEKG